MKTQYRIINIGKGILNINASNLHKVNPAKDVIIPSNNRIVFKVPPNNNLDALEINDTVTGYVEGNHLVEATYTGGDPTLLTSYNAF